MTRQLYGTSVVATLPDSPADVEASVRSGSVGWASPFGARLQRLPLIAVGLGVATVFFAVRGEADLFLLSLTTPSALIPGEPGAPADAVPPRRREGIRLRVLIGLDRARVGRDIGLCHAYALQGAPCISPRSSSGAAAPASSTDRCAGCRH